MSDIGVWGDSITYGFYDDKAGGWVARLRWSIQEAAPHRAVSVFNLGISGDKVADVLSRFPQEYIARTPQVIILAVGINDSPHASHPDGTDLETFELIYRTLVTTMMEKTERIILICPTNVLDDHPKNHGYRNSFIERYAEVIRKVAHEQELKLVDAFGLMSAEDLEIDGLHPRHTGHEKIYLKVKELLT
jgi:lysophospholipase L1-like esterase